MCGIVGYIGHNNASDYLLEGLEALEYRGYDSSGIALLTDNITNIRVVGRVEALRTEIEAQPLASGLGIGHTRWATHGRPLEKNAHPQLSENGDFAVVHNGIIENYQQIKQFLTAKGYRFASDTDTEVIPNLVDYHYQKFNDVAKAFLTATKELQGAYAIVLLSKHDPDHLYAAKLSSPLAIGVTERGETFIGSDGLPMTGRTEQVVYLQDGEAAIIGATDYNIVNLSDDSRVQRSPELLELESDVASKGDYPDFMSKEIHEAPQTVRSSMLGRLRLEEGIIKLGGLETVEEQLRYINRIIIIACGTSYYAGMVGEYLLEEIAGIPVEVQQASEFRYRHEPLSRSTAVLVISQSGETADAIAALKKLEGTGILRLGIVNAPGSTLARLTDAGVYCHAGPEKAVASTKAFIAQVTVLCLIALHLSRSYVQFDATLKALDELPAQLEQVLRAEADIAGLAKKYSQATDFLYIGRRYLYPVALEGALKLKEISYIHAEGFAGGEMKHGPLALIDEHFPTFAIALSSDIAEKSASNMQEIRSRGGPIIAVVDDLDSEAAQMADDLVVLPKTIEPLQPILAATATHLFAYHAARELGRDIDKPRNLAKSVTVE